MEPVKIIDDGPLLEWRAQAGATASRWAAERVGSVFEDIARRVLNHRGTRLDAWVGTLLPKEVTR